MKVYEITTQCGAKLQTAKLSKMESNSILSLTECPVICPLCKRPHGLESCSIREVEV
jgi:hypothetical protein